MTDQDKHTSPTAGVQLVGVRVPPPARLDVYSGVARMSGRIWGALHQAGTATDTVVVLVHPSSNFLGHYLLAPLAAAGVDALGLNTRYLGNDSALIMENCVVDLGAAVRHLRQSGYEKIVLVGNSGGGGLVALYQSQAESPSIRATPAGDPPNLTQADLLPADGIIELMAHPGRAVVATEWLDPSIQDEAQPFRRDAEIDMFNPRNGPPYDAGFLQRYREAQVHRNRRITSWVRRRLTELAWAAPDGPDDLPFVVHGTVADPRFLDPSIDPSDRTPGTLWGPAEKANFMPTSLGHHTSLRSWLSQWSVDESNCTALSHLSRTSVPTAVVYGSADQVCFPSHAKAIFDVVGHERKQLFEIEGGTHYLEGQPELVSQVCEIVTGWIESL